MSLEPHEKYAFTSDKIRCGHCAVESSMKVVCEGEDSFIIGDQKSGVWDDVCHKWQVLKCLACSDVNILQHSSSSLWEYTNPLDGGNTDLRPTYTDILYPDQISETSLELKVSTEAIESAIADMEVLITSRGPVSGVDRIHTALHGYLRAICEKEDIKYEEKYTITRLFKILRRDHYKLQNASRSEDIERLLNAIASILDPLNPIRNRESMAHPNEDLLGKDEASLVINVVRTLLRYLDSKLA